MSAIAGIFNFNQGAIPYDYSRNIMKSLEVFPADDVKTWEKRGVFLGCHAQWITPESVGEKLPYYDNRRLLAITADAIIDNRIELFEKLQISNNRTKAITDSELILRAYDKWKEECPKYLIGDFSFIIWDEREQKLFGARDFSGCRTLYFYRDHERFCFCTIMEPLFSLPFVKKELNEHWLAEYIAIPVTVDSTSVGSTVYQGIEQLPPSHSITIKNGKVNLERYSSVFPANELSLKSNEEYEEAFKEVVERSVADRLRTFRKVGAHLSGGLDSGTVASFAANQLKEQGKKLNTYSYVPVEGFVDWTARYRVANETDLIKSTVDYVGNISDQYFSFPNQSPYSEIEDWLDVMEMPYKFFENSFWLKGIYEQASKDNVGVLLNGQRGNWTISWGPVLDYYAMLLRALNFRQLYNEVKQYSNNIGVGKKRILKFVGKKAFPNIYKYIDRHSQYEFPTWISEEFAKKTNVLHYLEEKGIDLKGNSISSSYQIRRNQFEQLHFWGLNGTIGTKLSLRHSLWERDPTNDIRVIKFCLSVPENQFVQNGVDRALVRRSTKNLLPNNIRLNQRSRGVQGADGVYRMQNKWSEFIFEIEQLLIDPIISNYINIKLIGEYFNKLKCNPNPNIVFDFEFRVLMRSLILYRFLKRLKGGELNEKRMAITST